MSTDFKDFEKWVRAWAHMIDTEDDPQQALSNLRDARAILNTHARDKSRVRAAVRTCITLAEMRYAELTDGLGVS